MVLLAACDPVTGQTTTTLDDLPPPDLPGSSSTSTTTTPAPPVTNDPSPYTYEGYLPNGTDFRVVAPGSRMETMTLVQGVFFFQSDDGLIPVGEVRYARVGDPVSGTPTTPASLELNAGEWLVDILFNEDVLDALGAEALAQTVVTRGIELEETEGWPVIRLTSPFTWGYAGAVSPAVRFETFVIEPGCTEIAVACGDNRAVQVLALTDIGPGNPEMSQEQRDNTFVKTSATRSPLDPNYLNPGPLDPRLSADLIWTGEEMIVWGGKQARDGLTTLVDGAAFNPDTDEWRSIASFPLQGPQATRAVWADGEMIVVSPNGTFGYDPKADSWRTIGNGVVPSEWHDRMLYFEEKVYVWARSSLINELTLETGQWRPVDGPEMAMQHAAPFAGVLREVNERLIAITLDENVCFGKHFWQLNGDRWDPLPDFSLATDTNADCSAANQSASVGNSLVIWDEQSHPSAVYSPSSKQWREIHPIPLGGLEGPPGPVPMGPDHFLVLMGAAAIFDATTEEWTRVILPGQGTDAEMIWTGEEILAWGLWETFDAWRWAPGQTIIGGDEAT